MIPNDQTYFYLRNERHNPLANDLTADIVIIGGGMAGLSAAYECAQKGKDVVLLEKNYCGAGASGKSSGFITPNSELSFTDFARHYTPQTAEQIWAFITAGVNTIRSAIKTHGIACHYEEQDTIILANSHRALKTLQTEHLNLSSLGYPTFLSTQSQLPHLINAQGYYGAMGYKQTFGITAYAYCAQLKEILKKMGVRIYEETPVTSINGSHVYTAQAKVTGNTIIVCTDRYTPEFTSLKKEVFHVQTFIMLSQILTDDEIMQLFPNGPLLCWDTDLVYTYFRISDKRLLLGGGTMLHSYSSYESHNNKRLFKKLTAYAHKKFPQLKLTFEYMWPGLIGISHDIAPILGKDKHNPRIMYACAGTGLPISCAIGTYAAQKVIEGRNDLDLFFDPYRKPTLPYWVQPVIGKKQYFALSNAYNMIFK